MTKEGRENWKNGMEFLMSCIGVAVGLGNIWRFPYVCYKNGGGAFLIPYFICLVLVGFPQTLIQFTYPQYSNLGPGKVWICCPLFKGIGYGMLGITVVVSIYYNVIIAWALYYLANACRSVVPWATCGNSWNTDICLTRYNVTDISLQSPNITSRDDFIFKTPTEEFWENHVLAISPGIQFPGEVRWQLLLCNLTVWILCFLCVCKGIKLSGKIMYVAASLPYIFLTILFIKGLTLPGSLEGLKFYFIPRWNELLSITVWTDAATQALYSIGFGAGDLVVLASYNKFHHNLFRDAMIIPLVDAFTSLFAGCVIFVTLGYMANQLNVEIGKVVAEGPGIAFMVYPEALSTLPLPQLWSILFFFTIFLVGLDSQNQLQLCLWKQNASGGVTHIRQMVHIQNLATAFSDISPRLFQKRVSWTTAGICIAGFILGIPCVTKGGVYVIQLMDWYLASFSFMMITFLELFVISWFYGTERIHDNLEVMLGKRISPVWSIFWKFVSPLCTFFVLVFSIINHKPVKYGDTSYPLWSIGVGWLVGLIPVIPLPINMAITLQGVKGGIIQKLKTAIKPSVDWKPAISKEHSNEDITELDTFVAS